MNQERDVGADDVAVTARFEYQPDVANAVSLAHRLVGDPTGSTAPGLIYGSG